MKLQEHILNLDFPNIWAIHTELMATDTVLQVIVCCCKPHASSSTYI